MTKSPKANYEDLQTELDSVMRELQREDISVDRAVECYERGLELVKELESYLKTAENNIKKIKAKFNK